MNAIVFYTEQKRWEGEREKKSDNKKKTKAFHAASVTTQRRLREMQWMKEWGQKEIINTEQNAASKLLFHFFKKKINKNLWQFWSPDPEADNITIIGKHKK